MITTTLLSLFLAVLTPLHLTTNLLENTEGSYVEIRSEKPTFGWQIMNSGEGTLQTSYRILVASSPSLLAEDKADVWDSGNVKYDRCTGIKSGVSLKPSTKYWWTVRYTDNHGIISEYAKAKDFTTAATLDGVPEKYRVVKELQQAVNCSDKDGVFVADFGKDAYSQPRLTISSKKDGKVTVLLGEKMKDGLVDKEPGGSIRIRSQELQVKKGTHTYDVIIEPDKRNSTIVEGRDYNPVPVPGYLGGDIFPFRYCEVDGQDIKVKNAERYAVFYPFNDTASDFQSADSTMNAIWDLCKYTVKMTSALGVYIDGDRERIPYEADALINQLSHYCTDREYAMARYTVDYLCHNATWPTEWILQAVIMAWNDYMYTGDASLLERDYDILKARTLSDLRDSDGLISTKTGGQTPELMKKIGYAGKEIRDIVDWPQSGAFGIGKEEAGEADGYVFEDYNAVVNAFHYRSLVLMAQIADVLGHSDDAAKFNADAAATYDAFNSAFWDGTAYRDGKMTSHHSLHANMMALAFGLVPKENTRSVLNLISHKGMACSVYGAQFLFDALYDNKDIFYALPLLTSHKDRSWYHMIELGSTVTLEAWDEKYKSNLDWNHAWGSAPANIIPRGIFGIQPLVPGFRKFSVKANFINITNPELKVPTVYGDIVLHSSRNGRGTSVFLTVPAGTEAVFQKEDGTIETFGSGMHLFEMK